MHVMRYNMKRDLQLRMHRKLSVGRALLGLTGELTALPQTSPLDLEGCSRDREGTQREEREWKGGKGKERRGRMEKGRKSWEGKEHGSIPGQCFFHFQPWSCLTHLLTPVVHGPGLDVLVDDLFPSVRAGHRELRWVRVQDLADFFLANTIIDIVHNILGLLSTQR